MHNAPCYSKSPHNFVFSDEEMLKKLAFRESLLISEVDYPSDSMEVEPRPVGGLCLDIQMVDGYLPKNREMPTDAELDRAVFQTLQKAKQGKGVLTEFCFAQMFVNIKYPNILL